jgi:hypothetical protein
MMFRRDDEGRRAAFLASAGILSIFRGYTKLLRQQKVPRHEQGFCSRTEGTAKMVAGTSSRRSDAELESILYETASWKVMGFQGNVYCEVASLQLAIDAVKLLGDKGREVAALVRRCPAKVTVFPGQIAKLAKLGLFPIPEAVEAADFLRRAFGA